MAESKNSFIKSKMNQDLDSRLIPAGEYRSAFNIAVSQNEGSDVGTLKTVLGNSEIADFGFTNECNVEIIGYCVDDENNYVYLFFTNFIDTSFDKLSNRPPSTAICEIWRRNIVSGANTKLVEGSFLNFSITHPISGVNVLEDLLFFTDNRNQPRKINTNKANPSNSNNPNYYTNDDQISVIKYYPHDCIRLIKDYIVDYQINQGTQGDYSNLIDNFFVAEGGSGNGLLVKITAASALPGKLQAIEIIDQGVGYQDGDIVTIAGKIGNATLTLTVESNTTMRDKCSEKLPISSVFDLSFPLIPSVTIIPDGSGLADEFEINVSQGTISGPDLLEVDYTGALVKFNGSVPTPPGTYISQVDASPSFQRFKVKWPNLTPTQIPDVTQMEVGFNPDYEENWPGDCQYLKDKFVRFAYRFKFDDNEYSIISPFTQACFIPKQNGYFLSEDRQITTNLSTTSENVTDTQTAFESTEIDFFENSVTDVELLIPCPEFLDNTPSLFSNLRNQMHVEAIEIIYKNDDETVLKVADVITKDKFVNLDSSVLTYDYQSRKPIKVLPESELTRVSDKVPLRALTQEIVGNRVMYGNYIDGHSSLPFLNYQVNAAPKFPTEISDLKKEYQNHTLKQNRNYQVGIILTDRYGRQSDVILSSLDKSSIDLAGLGTFTGSTIYHPYKPSGWSRQNLITDSIPTVPSRTWPGDTLSVRFNQNVPENIGVNGYPGLFIGINPGGFSNLFGGAGYSAATAGNPTTATTTGGTGTGLEVDYVTFKSFGLSYITSLTISNPGTGYEAGDLIEIDGGSTPATFIYQPAQSPNLTGWYSYKIVVKQQEQDYYNVYLPGIVNGAINTVGIASTTEATISLFSDNINKVPRNLQEVGPTQSSFNSNVELSLRVANNYEDKWVSTQFYPDTSIEKVKTLGELTDLGFTLNRLSREITNVPSTTRVEMMGSFSSQPADEIVNGMAITVTSSTGTNLVSLSDGIYVTSSYVNAGGSPEVTLNKSITVNIGDTITFNPPGIIYNSNNNPLIGILNTSSQIGVAEEDDFRLQLAVAETKPFESALDIYYETSTSGLISSLNSAIQEGSGTDLTATPFAITTIDTNEWDESQLNPQVITNNFSLIDATNNTFIDPGAVANIISVTDGNNNPRDAEFKINDLGNGQYNISTESTPAGYVVLQDDNLTQFSFTVSIESQGNTFYKTFADGINNVRPIYGGNYTNTESNPLIVSKWGNQGSDYINNNVPTVIPYPYDSNGFDFYLNGNDVFSATNGSGDNDLNKQELQWYLESAICVDGENISQNQFGYWPSGWNPYPNSTTDTSAYIAVDQGNTTTYSPYQIIKNRDYVRTFTYSTIGRTGVYGPIAATCTGLNTWCAGLNGSGGNDGEMRLGCGAGLFGNDLTSGTQGGGAGGFFYQVDDPYNTDGIDNPLQTSHFVNYITFKLTFKVKDRCGSGLVPLSPAVGYHEIFVRFQ